MVGSPEAIARDEHWRDLDAIARLYADNGLGAIAIVTAFAEGRATAPADATAALAQVATVHARQRIAMPLEAALPAATTDSRTLAEHGALVHDPTVILVDRTHTVRWIGGVGPHWQALDLAIAEVLSAEPVSAP